MIDEYLLNHPSYKYANDVINNKITTGKYIKKEAHKFIKELENEDSKYFLDLHTLRIVDNLTSLLIMADGHKAGTTVKDSLAPFQWYFLVNALCWKYKDNPDKRKYEKSVLLIARKSGKSFLVSLIFVLLLLLEPQNSEFYSVAPDRELSSIVKKELGKIIESSPTITDKFKIIKSEITCLINNSKMVALATSDNRLDGRKANVYVADEVGALKNRYPIEAMESSQLSMLNRTGILISTAYQSTDNPMTQEVEYAEKVLDGIIEDESCFALLYKPDNPKEWMTDEALYQANPLCYDVPENYDFLVKKRDKAIEMTSARSNFLTKHLNIFVDGDVSEAYMNIDDLQPNKIDYFDWRGKEVYIGVDLSLTTDNTAVSMVHYDFEKQKYYTKSWSFIPEDGVADKIQKERVDYHLMRDSGWAYFCGDRVIDYRFVEDFIMSLEKKYDVKIKGIGYDKYQAISSMRRISEEAGYEAIEVQQSPLNLHSTFKTIKEHVLKGNFHYEKNDLLEIHFKNARQVESNNLDMYVNKKKSSGKIDMLFSTADAVFLWHKEIEEMGLSNVYAKRGLRVL